MGPGALLSPVGVIVITLEQRPATTESGVPGKAGGAGIKALILIFDGVLLVGNVPVVKTADESTAVIIRGSAFKSFM